MNIIYFTSMDQALANRLMRVLEIHVSRKQLKTYRSIYAFSERLRQPLPEPVVIVLHIASREELMDILVLRELLQDRRIILVLPDSESGMVSLGHVLRPRFITYNDSDYMEISAVLGKWATSHTGSPLHKQGADSAFG